MGVNSSFLAEIRRVLLREMGTVRNIQDLPAEVINLIFIKLTNKELLEVVKVCKEWKTLGESPSLWKEFRLMVKPIHFAKLNTILSMHRFKNVQTLFLNGGAQRLDNDSLEIILNSKISKVSL